MVGAESPERQMNFLQERCIEELQHVYLRARRTVVVLKSSDKTKILNISPCRTIWFLDEALSTPLLMNNVFYPPNVAKFCEH